MKLTKEDREMCTMLGNDPADVLKFRTDTAAREAAIAELTPDEQRMCASTGTDPAEYAEVKRADAQLMRLSAAQAESVANFNPGRDKLAMLVTAKTLGFLS